LIESVWDVLDESLESALSIQDFDQQFLMEMTSQHLFPSTGT